MNKKEAREVFRACMEEYGFNTRRMTAYRFLADDYLVGVSMEHRHMNVYEVYAYACYEAGYEESVKNEDRWYQTGFCFLADPADDFSKYDLEKFNPEIIGHFDCDTGTAESFRRQLQFNFERCVEPLFDRAYPLERYRENWWLLKMLMPTKRLKLIQMCGLNKDEVLAAIEESRSAYLRKLADQIAMGKATLDQGAASLLLAMYTGRFVEQKYHNPFRTDHIFCNAEGEEQVFVTSAGDALRLSCSRFEQGQTYTVYYDKEEKEIIRADKEGDEVTVTSADDMQRLLLSMLEAGRINTVRYDRAANQIVRADKAEDGVTPPADGGGS